MILKKERLQKYLAHAGVASRRKSEEIIAAGRVKVNDKVVREMGVKVSSSDKVEVDGKLIEDKEEKVYFLLHKPLGYVTTTDDQFDRKTVIDLIKTNKRVYPVGRLDYDSTGLLLITNDGEMTNRLIHPSYEVWKEYLVEIKGFLENDSIKVLENGLELSDGVTAPAKVKLETRNNHTSKVFISIREGKNRQIRRMFDKLNYEVVSLKRVKFGPLNLGRLQPGQYKTLDMNEIKQLEKLTNIKRR
jgi:23S rRNA pseudouridine2605 synthase